MKRLPLASAFSGFIDGRLVAALAAALVGALILKLKSDYLAIATLGFRKSFGL